MCIDIAATQDNIAGRVVANGLLAAYDSERYLFSFDDLRLLNEEVFRALVDIFILALDGVKVHRLINNGREFFESLAGGLFPEKQAAPNCTVSLHPAITHRQILTLLGAIDCEMKRVGENNYVIRPRQAAHTNTNIVKFPHHKGQFGATRPATPE
ncbi:MAG: hypothetical protein KZQ99_02360 [Candidatus Thiodiazotropha sp. (ex Dulcina madagascariensis)]|nr:hypothetical protein [Candidatus Thiodiazotropha sp. (ex Dulcina madagascariensis)]